MFQCKDLFNLSSLSKVKLLSGQKGLHKIIRWSYKAESIHLAKWVHGGELLIVSKMVINEKDFELYSFLKEAISLNMSGALLLTGPNYIEKIPQSVIDLSNSQHFPIFLISWDTPLIDIFEELGHAIVNINTINNKYKDLLFSIIFSDNLSANYLQLQSQEINFSFEGFLRFFKITFHLSKNKEILEFNTTNKENILHFIKTIFESEQIPVLLSGFSKNIIGLINVDNITDETLNKLFSQILNYIRTDYPDYTINIGIGTKQNYIDKYKLSYEQASKCISFAIKQKSANSINYYEHLGIYQLFYDINNKKLLEDFIEINLGKLISYDKKCKSNLMKTLYVYLNKNCNLYQTAEELFTHHNTVKYRLKKIEKILNKNLKDPLIRLTLFNALLMKKFLQ